MRRWIALLLMLLLPLQVSWSVAAEYGTHGATLGAPHAELHAAGHSHAGMAADAAAAELVTAVTPADGGSTDTDPASHAACCDLHQCHTHGSFAALTATAGMAAVASSADYATEQAGPLQSREATRIERPQWAASPISR